MKYKLLLFAVLLCGGVRAQIQATTNDGKAVTLKDDGTWSARGRQQREV